MSTYQAVACVVGGKKYTDRGRTEFLTWIILQTEYVSPARLEEKRFEIKSPQNCNQGI